MSKPTTSAEDTRPSPGRQRAAIYARTSTADKQDPQNQIAACRRLIEHHAYTLDQAHIYIDQITGSIPQRPAFRQLLKDARSGVFDIVVFFALDRFSREGVTQTLGYLRQLRDFKVNFRSVQEPYLDSLGPFSEAIIGILATIAEFERARIRERIQAGLQRRKETGQDIGGRPKRMFDIEQAKRLLANGHTQEETAAALGVSTRTLTRRLRP